MAVKAKADNGFYQQFKKDLSSGTIGNLYLFHGEEVYLRDHYLEQMKKKLLPGGMEQFNLHTIQAKEFSVPLLQELVDALPMMSERTMVVVYDHPVFPRPEKTDADAPVKKKKEEDKEKGNALLTLLSDLPPYVCLIFIYDQIPFQMDARTKLATVFKEQQAIVPFQRQDHGDLMDWVSRRFKALGHTIDREDAKYLLFLGGDLMYNLVSEIGKIGAYAKGVRVTREDIDAMAIPQPEAIVFHLTDAISLGDFNKAASILSDLLHMGEPPAKILAILSRHLRQLYSARLALEHNKGTDYLMAQCNFKSSYPAQKLMQSARRFSLPWCRRGVIRCSQVELAMKSTSEDVTGLLVALLMELATKKEVAPC